MKKNRLILIIITIVFTAIMAFFAWDMGTKTIKPWGKKNNVPAKYSRDWKK